VPLRPLPYEHVAVAGSNRVKRGMAEMLKGGVIMDVVNVEQARIAEDAGAVAVMALERVPADIRAQGGVSRMSDPDMIDKIIEAVSVPVMAKPLTVIAQPVYDVGLVAAKAPIRRIEGRKPSVTASALTAGLIHRGAATS